jgi:hypothetical protein
MKKWIKSFESFKQTYEAFSSRDKEAAIVQVLSYIKNNTEIDFYPYGEHFNIEKGPRSFQGELYLSIMSEKAIRFNWAIDSTRSEIHSIDLWSNFSFDSNPDYTLELNGNSIIQVLKQVFTFYISPEDSLAKAKYEQELELQEGKLNEEILRKALDDEKARLSKMSNAEAIEKQKKLISTIEAHLADPEFTTTYTIEEAEVEAKKDPKMDVFKTIELNTIQVARGRSNSLIITGQAGIGKTNTVTETLSSIGLRQGTAYFKATGDISTPGLYEILFKYRKRLILFDDCDAVFNDPDSVNMLKGALDTYEKRTVTNLKKGSSYYDAEGKDDMELDEIYDKDGKLPKSFIFQGQIIFVSNLPENKFDAAIISRSLHVDVTLSREEVIKRIRQIMVRISPEVEPVKREEAFAYLLEITANYPTKFDLNIRTLIHTINLRSSPENEEIITVADVSMPAWRWLVKQYLIKDKK